VGENDAPVGRVDRDRDREHVDQLAHPGELVRRERAALPPLHEPSIASDEASHVFARDQRMVGPASRSSAFATSPARSTGREISVGFHPTSAVSFASFAALYAASRSATWSAAPPVTADPTA